MAQVYTAVAGDTLAAIADRFYGDASKADLIGVASGVASDDDLQAGQMLMIP